MITAHRALEKILKNVSVLSAERVPLQEAVDRTLAQDLFAQIDLPPFNNSAMDGFAVLAEDVKHASKGNPITLKVRDKIRAGLISTMMVKKGEAIKIMTGAPLPKGATAIVIKEATQTNGKGDVRVFYPAQTGDNIRLQGEDVRRGRLFLKTGTRIRPYEVALLAAQGIVHVPVIRKPRVSLMATGDELVQAKGELPKGKIRNSNGPALMSALTHWKIEGKDFGIVKDDPVELKKKIKQALEVSDVLLITGGVSVGDFDYTKTVLEKLGVREVFWEVAIKPGKPLFFGLAESKTYVFGLPGNPISALVCLEEFVRPALEKLQGFEPRHPRYHLIGKALNDYPLPVNRKQYLFCQASRAADGFSLHMIRPQGSAMMGMAAKANALAVSPEGVRRIKTGDEVPFRWLK